jgi:hypothetical protein
VNDVVPCCAASTLAPPKLPLPQLFDEEGARVAPDLPPVIDAHVHVFPDGIFRAVWRWFEQFGWPVRYQLYADDVVTHLKSRGIVDMVLLHYAHKPGIARMMNAFVADVARRHGVIGTATICPGEPEQVAILEDAFALGLRGVKLHCHVQAMAADDARLLPVYALCQERCQTVVIHAGRAPHSDHLPVDPRTICDVARVESVLRQFPRLSLCVPHLGADEVPAYAALLSRYQNLTLDTTMMLAGYFSDDGSDIEQAAAVIRAHPERVLYGSDFPNLPYSWDRELRTIGRLGLPDRVLEALLGGNARALHR